MRLISLAIMLVLIVGCRDEQKTPTEALPETQLSVLRDGYCEQYASERDLQCEECYLECEEGGECKKWKKLDEWYGDANCVSIVCSSYDCCVSVRDQGATPPRWFIDGYDDECVECKEQPEK